MKKRFTGLIGVALAMAMLCSLVLSGCSISGGGNDNSNNNNNTQTTPIEYTIQYTDDIGPHTLTVIDGATYALETVPERLGYDFIGLFDAKVGGTQYVDETGQSLAPFSDKKNIVLFPRFSAKEYTVVLDYQGAAVTGQRSLTVKYNEKLPELPKNLSKEHSVFAGWYTEENCGGTQVADGYGLIPDKSTLNESLFDIKGAGEYLYLYAGFDVETFKVTFNFGSGIPSEEVEVEYNTPIADVVPETRNSEGQAVLSWSKTSSGDQIFTGNVTDDIVLYATEWAPVIELDLNGGEGKNAVIAREGATVALPTPVRENYKFLHWETMSGDEAEITKMPAEGAQLKAVWQAMLVFDENGGTEVKDISQEAGTAITLPIPEKEGFVFAGWYNADEEKYTATSMPAASVALKAGWYQTKTETIIIVAGDDEIIVDGYQSSSYLDDDLTIDLSKFLPSDFNGIIRLEASLRYAHRKASLTNPITMYMKFYSQAAVSENYFLFSESFTNQEEWTYVKYTYDRTVNLSGNKIYCAYSFSKKTTSNPYISDYYIKIYYPDTTNLYL